MVTQQILVLFFLVRIRVAQLKSRALRSAAFFCGINPNFIINPKLLSAYERDVAHATFVAVDHFSLDNTRNHIGGIVPTIGRE